jgi:hypothetical protein
LRLLMSDLYNKDTGSLNPPEVSFLVHKTRTRTLSVFDSISASRLELLAVKWLRTQKRQRGV